MAEVCCRLAVATTPETQDEFAPILPGPGASDYERYLRTDELLALQKTEAERAHHDELLFQTVHQASELWLKLAWSEAELATAHLRKGELAPAIRLLQRSIGCLQRVDAALDMLEFLSPWEYTRWVRPVLGHGSGFDSPGFRELRRVAPDLGAAFHELRRAAGLSVVELYQRNREFEQLYTVAELLIELDERIGVWRIRHLKMIGRIIGEGQIGTPGDAGRAARQADPPEALPRALGRAQRADGHREPRDRERLTTVSLRDETAGLLQQLIRLDTVNPPGNETAAAELLRGYLESNGVQCELYARVPDRANLVARIPGGGDGPRLLMLSHTDTVLADPAEWQVDPWSGELRDGEIWGRGALDMKGEVAASAVAIASLAREGFRPAGDLIFLAAADEEVGDGFGLQWLVEEHPDAVRAEYSVNEGAGDRLVLGGRVFYVCGVAEKMTSPFTLRVHGRSGHASMPRIADNALVKAARAHPAAGRSAGGAAARARGGRLPRGGDGRGAGRRRGARTARPPSTRWPRKWSSRCSPSPFRRPWSRPRRSATSSRRSAR